MRAARIENGVVADLWEVPALDVYGSIYTLVEAPEWVRLGATWNGSTFVNPPEPPTPVPQTVSMSSARIVLRRTGLLASVEAAINAMPADDREEALLRWEYASVVERNSPLTLGIAAALGLTAEQVDNLFRQAAAL